MHLSIAQSRERIAFYASTPAYQMVLDLYGWGELHAETRQLTREDHWDELVTLIDDEMLRTFTVIGAPDEIGTPVPARTAG